MRYATWIIKFVLLVLVLTFAVRNTEMVTVRYFLGWEWQSPLIFVLLIALYAGIALGLAAGLAQMFRQRREIAALKRDLRERETGRSDAETAASSAKYGN